MSTATKILLSLLLLALIVVNSDAAPVVKSAISKRIISFFTINYVHIDSKFLRNALWINRKVALNCIVKNTIIPYAH